MITQDARRLSAAALEDLRRRAVAAVEAGESRVEVARLFGVSRKTVGSWVLSYRDLGENAFRPRTRGRRPGEQLALSPAQQERTVKLIVSGKPADVGLPYEVWVKQAIAELVNREFRIMLGTRTVGEYLARWGLVPRVDPLGPAGGRAPAEVAWLAWVQPSGTEAPVRLDACRDVNVLLARCARGVLYFDARPEPFDANQVGDFLRRLRAQTGRVHDVVVCRWPVRHVDAFPAELCAVTSGDWRSPPPV